MPLFSVCLKIRCSSLRIKSVLLRQSFFPRISFGFRVYKEKWEAVDENSAQATMGYKGVAASAIFQFNAKGELTNMIAERYRTVGKRFELDKWSTPVTAYRESNGLIIPIKGEGVWNLSTGDFSYIKLEITDIEYNHASVY
ncbi:MAG: DUF6920 family protein [bacterium]